MWLKRLFTRPITIEFIGGDKLEVGPDGRLLSVILRGAQQDHVESVTVLFSAADFAHIHTITMESEPVYKTPEFLAHEAKMATYVPRDSDTKIIYGWGQPEDISTSPPD